MSSALNVTLWLPDLEPSHGGIQRYLSALVEEYASLSPRSNIQLIVKNNSALPESLRLPAGIRTVFFGSYRGVLRTLMFGMYCLLHAIFSRPNLIICGHVRFAPLAGIIKRFFSIPYVVCTYGVEVWEEMSGAQVRGLHEAVEVLTISSHTEEKLHDLHQVDESKIRVLPCTFDPNRFTIGERSRELLDRHKISSDSKIVLTVTRLEARESYHPYDSVLKAIPKIREQVPNVHYILVGDGNDRDRILHYVSKEGFSDCVTLTGYVSEEELPRYYQLCDLFLLPSKLEGFGIVFLEALASGKPVVGGNQDGARDALLNGQLGELIDPDDEDALVEAVARAFEPGTSVVASSLREEVIDAFGPERFRERVQGFVSGIPAILEEQK